MRRSDFLKNKISEKQVLIAILLLAAVLRLWGLGSAEFFHDEGFKAFRSIGFLDYLQNDDQTTPIQWFKDLPALPWWTSLSFHDHPPLFFLIQNLFFKIFGISLFAARLPSAIAGVLSVYLTYLISRKTFTNKLSVFLPPLLLSVNLLHLWISRASLMESTQIFFLLLNIYYFFQFLEDRRKWKAFGFTLGLAFLTKYTSAYLVPVYLTYWIYKTYWSYGINGTNRTNGFYKSYWIYFLYALALAAVIFSPALIYNFNLWIATGHFDLQFAYLFRQPTPEWRASLGKIQDPFSEILSNLTLTYSLPFLLAVAAGIGLAIYKIFNLRTSDVQNIKNLNFRTSDVQKFEGDINYLIFWLFNIIFITLMLVAVGSGFRFIVLYAAPAAMLITFLVDYLLSRFPKNILLLFLIAIFAIYELIFASDLYLTFPDFGIVKLDNYLDSELGDKRSLAIPASPNPHLNKIIKSWAIKIPPGDRSMAVVYDSNIGLSPRLWLFTRRNYYLGIPNFNVDQFDNFLKKGGLEEFKGYDIYFVRAAKNTILNPLFQNNSAAEMELNLNRQGALPAKIIYGNNGLMMFTVYKFKL